MAAVAIDQRTASWQASARNDAVPLLQAFALAIMIFPSDYIIKAVGAGGYVAALISYVLFIAWLANTLFGRHDPLAYRNPVRTALWTMWVVSLASYAAMNRWLLSIEEQASADRWLMQLAGISGIILVAAEYLQSLEDIKRLLRVLLWGATFCGAVAAMQFWLKTDITTSLHLPGFTLNQAATGNIGIGNRGGVNRVPGTAIDPIELGVSAGMLLPLAVYMAIHDLDRAAWRRWTPVIFVGIAIASSVSRAAILSVIIGIIPLIVSLPPAKRLWALSAVPVAIAGVFFAAHGLIGTLKAYFTAGTNDASIAHRVNNYPFVEQLVRHAPWVGQGGGTYIAPDTVHILDNQYLTTAIELGLAGLAAMAFYFLWPALAALIARRRATNPELRDLCAALVGAQLAAGVCSAAFDSFSFPMYVSVQALVAGLIGATWLLANRQSSVPEQAWWSASSNGSPHRS